jgi:sialic acid synthase SpsE
MKTIKLEKRLVGEGQPAYLIAEIGSNFDGSIKRAKMLIDLAKKSGADAVKFQSFKTDKIISREGFEGMRVGFQSKWKKPVYQVYKDAEFPREWHKELFDYAKIKGVHFFSTPYDAEAVDILDKLNTPVFKIGSGDITWHEMIRYIAKKKKPIILGTGASTLVEVEEAIEVIRSEGNDDIVLLQCVTNYPSRLECANIKSMRMMADRFNLLVGYSDHTLGPIVPLGAVALGACIIEKHFTDNNKRIGPDHPFAMDSKHFKEMVDNIRLLEKALGSSTKEVYDDEKETVVLQRRCLRAAKNISKGTMITEDMIDILRPLGKGSLDPKYKDSIIGLKAKTDIRKGHIFSKSNV